MKRKLKFGVIGALVLACLMLAACIIESERPAIRGPWLVNDQPISGWIDLATAGYMGGNIFIALYLDEAGRIRWVDFDLSADTQSHVGPLPETITPIILLTNSFNFPNTIVSGATGTAQRLTDAVRAEFVRRGVPEAEIGF